MQLLVIIGTAPVPAKYIKTAVAMMKLRPVFIGQVSTFPESLAKELSTITCFDVDLKEQNKVEDIIVGLGLRNIAAITSLYECHLEIAVGISKKFQIKGPDDTLLVLRDKSEVAKMIPNYCPPFLSFGINELSTHNIKSFIDQYGAVIVKPSKGAGGVGAMIVKDKTKIKELEKFIREFDNENGSVKFILQSLVSGILYSVEGFCINGKPSFIGFSRRVRYEMTEVTNYFPSDNDLHIQQYKSEMLRTIEQLIKYSAFQNGYFHTEFICSSKNFFLIDANFGRIAGTSIIEQIATSYSLNPAIVLRHVIDVGVIQSNYSELNIYKNVPAPSLSISYGLQESSHFERLEISQNLNCYHTVLAKEHNYIHKIGVDDDSWIGTIAGEPQKVLEGLNAIQVKTYEGKKSPFWQL
jgi:hypothetical protein